MPKNKKKFIPKDKALVFQLVHRSQQDPLAVDENAPQHVLKECSRKKNREEEHKYGIFFDDEYDYLQHLKTVSEPFTSWEQLPNRNDKKKSTKPEQGKVLLPSSVFQSQIEEPIGFLNRAAPIYGPRPDLDPDIVAAMEDDFDYDNPDNILEENFVEIANQSMDDSCEEYGSEMEDSVGDLRSESSMIETKSRFTDYSMSSSVIRRNKQLMMLDDHFEKVFETYDSNEIGCLAHEDIEGNVCLDSRDDSERLLRLATETEDNQADKEEDMDILKKKTMLSAQYLDLVEEETDILSLNDDEVEKWDCQTIISTYSNIYNHPAKICEIKDPLKIEINKKTGIPRDVLSVTKLTARALATLDESQGLDRRPKSIVSHISELSIRPKNETSEERKIRKGNVKQFRRERRMEKKANILAFKDEKCRQEKVFLNMKKNQRSIKML